MRESDPAELKNSLLQIATGVDRAAHLVNQLLVLARAEASDEAQHAMVPIDPDILLREIVSEWVTRPPRPPDRPRLRAGGAIRNPRQPFLLRELISNLIDNALRYTRTRGKSPVASSSG